MQTPIIATGLTEFLFVRNVQASFYILSAGQKVRSCQPSLLFGHGKEARSGRLYG